MTSSDSPAPARGQSLWRRFTAAYAALISHLVVVSIAVLLIPVSLQIISRHTALIPSYIWTEEMARFLFIWTISLGAMLGVRESTHFEVDVMPELGPRGEALARLTGRVGILVLAGVFVFAGIHFVEFAWYRTSELADLPLWLIHLPWPLMGLSWIVFLGEQMLDDILILAGRKAPPAKLDPDDIETGTLNI